VIVACAVAARQPVSSAAQAIANVFIHFSVECGDD
jgi:hypothetical protein